VGLRQVDVGNIVHAADANGLVVVTQLQPIAVIFTVPEDQLPGVRKKLLAKKPLKVEAYDRSMTTKLATGTLLTVDNQIDPTTGTDKLKAVFPNKDNALFPNQFVNVRLTLEDRPNVLVGSGITEGPQLLLDGGVKPGEKVVIDGQEKIHAGSKIVISKGAPAKADAGAGAGDDTKGKGSKGAKGATGGDAAASDDTDSGKSAGKGKGKGAGKSEGGAKVAGDAAGAAQ
jgi:multidrug efflux system membrane fusion protein